MGTGYEDLKISDEAWELIEPLLPKWKSGSAQDSRQFVSAVLWVLQNEVSWRKLPSKYGNWNTVHRRFSRWRDKRIWEDILLIILNEPEFEWLFVYKRQSGVRIINKEKSNVNSWPWMRLVCRMECLSERLPKRTAGLLGIE